MKNISAPIFWTILIFVSLLSIVLITNKSEININFLSLPKLNQEVASEVEVESPYPLALIVPINVKGIYLTGYTFSNEKRRSELIDLVRTTELNSVVIDFKDPSGKLMFIPVSEKLKDWSVSPVALNYDNFKNILTEIQNDEIYTIARITTFQDSTAVKTYPDLALKNKLGGVWSDYKGVTWLDMTNEKVWELIVDQAREAALVGFDEVQFDYIRFPSDGNTSQIKYSNFPDGQKKYETITAFFKYLKSELSDLTTPLSIDLFGLTYQRRSDSDYDLNIGQRLVDAAQYFDYISPMVYPSHYPSGFLGFANPATQPYEIVNKALAEGNLILASTSDAMASTRPWLQDFDLGANYDASMIKAQIRAADENEASGWLLWNARNVYTVGSLGQ